MEPPTTRSGTRGPPSGWLADARQRVTDEHVDHASAAEAGADEDHPLRLLAHLADARRLGALGERAHQLEGAGGVGLGDDGDQHPLVGDIERLDAEDLAAAAD